MNSAVRTPGEAPAKEPLWLDGTLDLRLSRYPTRLPNAFTDSWRHALDVLLLRRKIWFGCIELF